MPLSHARRSFEDLQSKAKKALISRCLTKLKPGGWFINIDEMKTTHQDSYLRSMQFWVEHVAKKTFGVPEELREEFSTWKDRIDKWAVRNIEHISKPNNSGDDI